MPFHEKQISALCFADWPPLTCYSQSINKKVSWNCCSECWTQSLHSEDSQVIKGSDGRFVLYIFSLFFSCKSFFSGPLTSQLKLFSVAHYFKTAIFFYPLSSISLNLRNKRTVSDIVFSYRKIPSL